MLDDFKFHHIGYVVGKIEDTASYYINSGFSQSIAVVDSIQNVRIAFLKKDGFPLIELVEAINELSPTTQILEKSGVSPYHICYEVDDIEDAIKRLKKMQFIPLFKPVKAIAIDNRMICYLYNKNVGLIELLNV